MNLPVVWRPRRVRRIAFVLIVVVLVGAVVLAIIVPEPYKIVDRLGLVAFGSFIATILYLLARCRVVADESGLTVVNVVRTHHYEWAEVLRVNMGSGASWPFLDLADGTSVGAMGIQTADGEQAQRALEDLRALLHRYGEAPDPR